MYLMRRISENIHLSLYLVGKFRPSSPSSLTSAKQKAKKKTTTTKVNNNCYDNANATSTAVMPFSNAVKGKQPSSTALETNSNNNNTIAIINKNQSTTKKVSCQISIIFLYTPKTKAQKRENKLCHHHQQQQERRRTIQANKKSEKRKFLKETTLFQAQSLVAACTVRSTTTICSWNRTAFKSPVRHHFHFGAKINESHLKVIADKNLFLGIFLSSFLLAFFGK